MTFSTSSRFVVLVGVIACAGTALRSHPNHLSYFNEFLTSRLHGTFRLVHSNLDWGQGLLSLAAHLDDNAHVGPIAIAYSGPVDPDSFGCRVTPIDWYRTPSPLAGYSHVAISANILAGDSQNFSWYTRISEVTEEFETFFRTQTPIHVFSGSMFLFDAHPYNRFYEQQHPHLKQRVEATREDQAHESDLTRDMSVDTTEIRSAVGLDQMSVSEYLHILLLYGLGETTLDSPSSGTEVFRLLTDERLARAKFGRSPLVRTPDGVRYVLLKSVADHGAAIGETHRDQCLCVFLGIGVPDQEPIIVDSERLSIRDLIAESFANFTLQQRELSWTIQAYLKCVPPARSWRNRFGGVFTFTEATDALLAKDLMSQSCAGLHVVETLAAIIDADNRFGLLEPACRLKARRTLDKWLTALVAHQRSDGHWDTAWNATEADSFVDGELASHFLITAHILAVSKHGGLRLPSPLCERGRSWLRRSIRTSGSAAPWVHICPMTHAIQALQL